MSKKSKTAASVKGMAVDTWEKLEQMFELRVVKVLNAMQIPTHDDIQELGERVEALTQAVEKLSGKPVSATARKTAAKKTSRKKTGGRKKAGSKTTRRNTAGRKKTRGKSTSRRGSKAAG